MELIQHKNKYYIKSETGYREVLATTDKSLKIIEKNQCDGCQAGLPLDGFIHKDGQTMGIACSKDKYSRLLPQPSQAFIEKYCRLGGIDEVLVEYEKIYKYCNDGKVCECNNPRFCKDGRQGIDYKLKVDSHNAITIHPIKYSWSKEEVNELCDLYESIIHGDFHTMMEEDMWDRIKELKN